MSRSHYSIERLVRGNTRLLGTTNESLTSFSTDACAKRTRSSKG